MFEMTSVKAPKRAVFLSRNLAVIDRQRRSTVNYFVLTLVQKEVTAGTKMAKKKDPDPRGGPIFLADAAPTCWRATEQH